MVQGKISLILLRTQVFLINYLLHMLILLKAQVAAVLQTVKCSGGPVLCAYTLQFLFPTEFYRSIALLRIKALGSFC